MICVICQKNLLSSLGTDIDKQTSFIFRRDQCMGEQKSHYVDVWRHQDLTMGYRITIHISETYYWEFSWRTDVYTFSPPPNWYQTKSLTWAKVNDYHVDSDIDIIYEEDIVVPYEKSMNYINKLIKLKAFL